MNLRKRVTVILSAGLLIVLVVGVNGYHTVRQLVHLTNQVLQTQQLLQKTQLIQAQLTSLDNDLRGHILSDSPYFKADYDRTAIQLADELKKVQGLVDTNPDQQQRVDHLIQLLTGKLNRSKRLFVEGSIAEGHPRLDSIKDVLDISDQFRLLTKTVENDQEQLLATLHSQTDRSANYSIISNGVGAVAALMLIAWAIYILIQTLESTQQLNKKLKESERRSKNFLDAVPISVVVMNTRGDFYYANKAATTLFGEATSSVDNYFDTLKAIKLYRVSDGRVYPLAERPVYRAMQGEQTRIDDMEMRLNERSIQVMTSATPVYDSEGLLTYVVSSTVDISDRAQSEVRLKEAKELAEAAAQLKENFLANMSHEIRTPLNAIIGYSNLLETTPLNEEQKEFSMSIRTAGKNLLTIVNDILDISKIEAGMLQFESIPFSVSALTGSIQTMFQAAATDKNLKLSVTVDPTLPPVLLGDPTRLTQILLNLISNAIKFTKDGSVTVSIKKTQQTAQSARVRFMVEDTGIGMDAATLPYIFERFRQATDGTTRFYGGTGLGLNIVKRLTEMQGGWVKVESTPGKGSCFTVEISYQIASERSIQGEPVGQAIPGEDGRQLTILVVEDNLMNQKLAMLTLKRLGYSTLIADNGRKALDILQRGDPVDLILMDIQMPVMDGYETTRHIRNSPHRAIPIIAMTAHALASEREQCLQAGMNDFISKPFQVSELQRILREYLAPLANSNTVVEDGRYDGPPVLPKPSFSVELLMKAVENDADFAAELLTIFLNQTTTELETLKQALHSGDVATIGRIVHTQKVPTQMFGMAEATRQILTIETLIADKKGIEVIGPLVTDYMALLQAELPGMRTVLADSFTRYTNLDNEPINH